MVPHKPSASRALNTIKLKNKYVQNKSEFVARSNVQQKKH